MIRTMWQTLALLTLCLFYPAGRQVFAAPEAATDDAITALIALSDQHFKAGQKELEQGHVEVAQLEFNRAIDVLVESPYGARTEPRVREVLDHLVDRIGATEAKARGEGDGFTETRDEPASIDELLSATSALPTSSREVNSTAQLELKPTSLDIPIPLNQRVLSYIDLFQGRLHDFIEDGMKRGSKYLPMIQSVFRAEGLPLDLAYVPLVESAFKPNALSRANARGVWQFMSGTAVENGLRRDWFIDERSDPEKATAAAARYLASLSRLFGGDWHLALASYNGGPGRLQRALKSARLDDFWKLADKPKLLPRETREYVPMILAAIVIARNPAEYGFDFEPEAPSAYDKVMLPRPVDLRRVAEWAGTSTEVIQALNPELRRWTTPVQNAGYELKVPAGTADVVRARLEASPSDDLASLRFYTVKRGETLTVIARKLAIPKTDLAEANYMALTARVVPGQKLLVPHPPPLLVASGPDRPVRATKSRVGDAETDHLGNLATSNRVRERYLVKQGDTLTSVARLFKTSVAALESWNPTLADGRLTAGVLITVYKLAS